MSKGRNDTTAGGNSERDRRDLGSTYRTLLENLPDIVYRLDLQGTRRMQFFNDRITELTGYSPEEFSMGRVCSMESHMAKDDCTRVAETVDKAIRKREPFEVEYRFLHKDGSTITFLEKGTVVCDAACVPLYIDGIIRDISGRKATEEALRASEARWRLLIDTSAAWIWEADPDGHHTYTNAFVTTCLGYQTEEFLGADILSFIHPDDHALLGDIMRNARTRKIPWSDQVLRWRHKDGSWRYIESSGSAVFDAEGNLVGLQGVDRDVTKRRKAEEALRESEEQLRALSSNLADGMVYQINSGPDGLQRKFTFISPVVGRFHGLKAEDVLRDASLIYEQIVENDRNIVAEQEARAYAERSRLDVEVLVRLPSGDLRWRRFVSSPRACPDGSLMWDGIELDITERKQAEQALRASESRYRAIVDSQAEFVVRYLPGGVITFVNDTLCRYIGMKRKDLLGKSYYPFMHPDDRDAFVRKIEALDRNTPDMVAEARVVLPDGRIAWHRWNHHAIFDSNGRLIEYQCTGRDITDLKLAQEALQKSEKMLQTIIDAEPECVKLLDEHGGLIMMNRAGLAMIEAGSLEQVKGQCICPMVTSEYRPAFMDLTRHVFQGGSGTLVFEIVGLKGKHSWLETHAVPLRNEKDEIVALLGVTRDITERKRVDEALRTSESRFRTITESATSGILVVDASERKFVYANPEICRMLGYPREELLALEVHDIHPVGEHPKVQEAFSSQKNLQTICRRKDGTTFPVDIKPISIELEGKQCLAGFFSDISEKLLLEEEQLKSQKLESIGTLAGGIAHDFNNLLQGLFGYISMAKMALDRPERVQEMLQQAEEALHLSVNLTTQLLTFAKGGKPIKKLIWLRPAIENAVKFSLSGSHTDCLLNLANDLWPVEADEGQLSQVLQNIVLNASEAMAGRGTVNISAENREIPAGTVSGLQQGGPVVRITIQDSGIGIPPDNLARIFDPYFTTKHKGSGLGLATSYSIIRNHGGVIDVTSKVNKGSLFTIWLPAVKNAEVSREPAAPATAAPKKGKILLMDDEELVRDVARAMITVLGHEVECAADGRQTIDLFRQRRDSGNPFDLVILDLTVKGGMGGEEAIGILRQIDPGVVAVVSSGYADSPVVSNYRAYGFAAYLNKPYKIGDLKDCLTGLLTPS